MCGGIGCGKMEIQATSAREKRETNSANIGHVGPAVKATPFIDVPSCFLGKDRRPGLKAWLEDVSLGGSNIQECQ